ncbi:ROK family protein [Phocicoccus schoeneichii]|uniref:ROK family protein n=1 Tax=Phocicoccus schoeneichii TaxID=1812261 RepID=UPI003D146B20
MMVTTHSTIIHSNKNIILSLIMNHPEISRAEITLQSGLNKATVSKTVRELIDDSFIIESGTGNSSDTGGRKPILLKINKKAGIAVSFDVRFDQISYMACYLNGEVIETKSIRSPINRSNVIFMIEEIVRGFNFSMDEFPFGLIGMTIAIHGIVLDNQISYTPYYDLDQIDLSKELEEKLNVPIYLENEANLAALAESTLDSSHNNLITCSIHTGVGAGIIIDQKLYRGNDGRSGEIGHTTLYPHGIPCPCGSYGCLEQYCSENALLYFYREATQNSNLSLSDLTHAFHKEHKLAIRIIQEYAKNLSMGLTSVIGNYGPGIIYINSQVTQEIPIIIDWIEEHLSHTIYNNVPIRQAKSSSNASLFGGCVTSIQKFLNVDQMNIELN